jgi:hypothetical protein
MLDWNRILSLLVAAFYIVTAYWLKGGEVACKALIFILFPTACIWFSDAVGGYTGNMGSMPITQSSPGIFVRLLGWVLLLLPVILAGFQFFSHGKS